jgi:hypothetical protein
VPKCKFRSYLLHQRQAYIVHRLWITLGQVIFCTPSVDYSTAGRLFTPSVDYSRAGHLLYTFCGLQYGRTFIVHYLWITVGPHIYLHRLWIKVGPDICLRRLWITIGPDVYCTLTVDYSRAGYTSTLYTICVVFYPICKSSVCSISLA